MKNTDKRLRELSDSYEVKFDAEAWDKMETLLPDAAPSRKPFFKRIKILAVMTAILVAVAIAVSGLFQTDKPDTQTQAAQEIIAENQTNDQAKAQTPTEESTPPQQTPEISDFYTDATPTISAKTRRVTSEFLPNLEATKLKKTTESAFFKKIQNTLADWNAQSSPEKVYVHTDRPQYKPGESLWFSVYLRNAGDLLPSDKSDFLHVEWLAPNGKAEKTLKLLSKDGLATGDIAIPQEAVGGTYTLRAYTNWQKNTKTVFEKKIQVQKSVLPRLRMELDFEREAYGPGDLVQAELDLNTLANKALKNYFFNYSIAIDGEPGESKTAKTDRNGQAKITFNLAQNLASNDGLLSVLIDYEGQTESISRAVPIVLNKIDLQFFPESGQNLADREGRTAFKALNEWGEPADIEGEIYSAAGEKVTDFSSYHDGMGDFTWTPKRGTDYYAVISKPAGISSKYDLAVSEEEKYAFSLTEQTKDYLKFKVSSTWTEKVHLIAQSRDEVFYHQKINTRGGEKEVIIPTADLPIGIVQVTLFDNKGIAQAERLVFVNRDKKLQIDIETDKEEYQARDKVKLDISVRDEAGKPVAGTFSLSVADDNLLTFADDKQAHILSQMLLQADVRGKIHEPNFYFDKPKTGDTKDRAKALDLLLMTQGWRRFDWKSAENLPVAEVKFPAERAIIGGQVVNQFGEPEKDRVVTMYQGQEQLSTITDNEGCFLFEDLDYPHNYIVYAGNYRKGGRIGQTDVKLIVYDAVARRQQKALIKRTPATQTQLSGQLTDHDTGEPILFGTVTLNQNGKLVTGTETDFDGNFTIAPLKPGVYDIIFSYVGYESTEIKGVELQDLFGHFITAQMYQGATLEEVVVVEYAVPLVEMDNTTMSISEDAVIRNIESGNVSVPLQSHTLDEVSVRKSKKKERNQKNRRRNAAEAAPLMLEKPEVAREEKGETLRAQDIINLPTRNVDAIVAEVAGLGEEPRGSDLNIRGSRADGVFYYVDGVRVQGNLVPEGESNQIELFLSGTPASENEIRIRGLAPVAERKDPLFLLDGQALPTVADRNIDFVNTDDIEKIEVLGKTEAQAIYGSRAANGAIQITTKDKNGLSEQRKKALLEKQINSFENFVEELRERIALGTFTAADNSSLNPEYRKVNLVRAQLDSRDSYGYGKKLLELYKKANIVLGQEAGARAFKKGFYRGRTFYVPRHNRNPFPEQRNDYRSTIYWNPKLVTDKSGKGSVEFFASDEITTFKATLEGFGSNGQIGRGEHRFHTVLPFTIDMKTPPQAVEGDLPVIPVTIKNNRAYSLSGSLEINSIEALKISEMPTGMITLAPGQQETIYLLCEAFDSKGKEESIEIVFDTGDHRESVISSPIKVVKRGYPVNEVISGASQNNKFEVTIAKPVEGSLEASFHIYPRLEDEIIRATERMLRQPSGCFEQTSSSNYPNLLVMDLLKSTQQSRPKILAKAQEYLDSGYKRLIGFEIEGGGFDWFGRPPAHEALTAYGLMQFKDMQAVYPVEHDLIERTADWLLKRKDGRGGWLNAKRGLHSWSAKTPVADAYITWALSEAGYASELTQEMEKSYSDAKETKDAYIMALTTLSLQNANDKRAEGLLSELLSMQEEDGSWTGLTHSMTHSKGKSLSVETTALATMALVRNGGHGTVVEQAIRYLFSSKNNYGFGNTQSTVLALKALVEYQKKAALKKQKGEVALYIDGERIGKQTYSNGQSSAIVFSDLSPYFTEGSHTVEVKFSGKDAVLPFDLSVNYATTLPPSSADCAVRLTTDLKQEKVKVGENVRFTAEIQNVTNSDVANPIAVIAVPAGLSLQAWQLKTLSERGLCDYYELKGNNLVLYYRGLAAGERKQINLDLKADIAGSFESPASVAYLYYHNEHRDWVKAQRVVVE